MARYLWNKRTQCEVAPSDTLNVDAHPDLEWIEPSDPEPVTKSPVEAPVQVAEKKSVRGRKVK